MQHDTLRAKSRFDLPVHAALECPPCLPLSDRINIATRPLHSQLNKLIIDRLPLALPPHSMDPSIYVSGILHIVPIYHTFESLWQALLDSSRQIPTSHHGDSPKMSNDATQILGEAPQVCGAVSSRLVSLLSHLRLPELLRAKRLRADLKTLTGLPEHLINDQITTASTGGELANFIKLSTRSIGSSPHVLIAYSWVFYMALFAGGRYIRATLQHAGGLTTEFWAREASLIQAPTSSASSISDPNYVPAEITGTARPLVAEIPPRRSTSSIAHADCRTDSVTHSEETDYLQFFGFASEEDGEALKKEFKKRLAEVEVLLEEVEKDDIICEAIGIFESMISLVKALNYICGSRLPKPTVENGESTMNGTDIHFRRRVVATSIHPSPRHDIKAGIAIAYEQRQHRSSHQNGDAETSARQRSDDWESKLLRPRSDLSAHCRAQIDRSSIFDNNRALRRKVKTSESIGKAAVPTGKLLFILSGFGLCASFVLLVLVWRMSPTG